MELEGEELLQFINSTLPDTLTIDYHSNTRLSEEESCHVLGQLKRISEFPRCLNRSCIIRTCEDYYQNIILFPCCGYHHGACSQCLKTYFTSTGLTCPMCRSNIIENIPVLQPQQKSNIHYGLSPNENSDLFQGKKHAEIGHYIGHDILINNSNATISFKKSTFCMKVIIPKKSRTRNYSENRRECVFYKNINLETQKKIMEFVLWYQEKYTNNEFHSENILWHLICDITEDFKEITSILKKEFQNENYMKLYDNFIDCLYNLSKKYLKTSSSNINNIDKIELLKNKEKATYLKLSVVRNSNYQDDIEFIKQNTLSFYHTSLTNVKKEMYQFVGKLNCLIEGNNLNSQKSIWEKISGICSSMARVHQFLISYLNSNNLDNSFTENNNLEQQHIRYLPEVYQLLFKSLNLYYQSYVKIRSDVYSDLDIKTKIEQIQTKIYYNYHYYLIDSSNTIRKITIPIINFANGFIPSTENRLNLIDICVLQFKNWLISQLSSDGRMSYDIWNFIALEMHYFNSTQKYFHILSYETISDIVKSYLQKLKQKVETLINNITNRSNNMNTIVLPNFDLLY